MGYAYGFKKGLIVGAALGAVGAYVVFRQHEKLAAKLWMLKVKADIYRRIKNLKRFTKENYEDIVDDVLARYNDVENIAAYELEDFAAELKRKWKDMKREFEERAQAPVEKDEVS